MGRTAGYRNAPIETRPRNREVRQAATNEAQDFIPSAIGLDKFWIALDMRDQPVGIGGQTEKPAFLDGPFNRRTLGGEFDVPFPFGQFLFIVKSFVANRIPAFVTALIDIAICFHRLTQGLARGIVRWRGRSTEAIIESI